MTDETAKVEQIDRDAAADLLDEISNLLDHNGLGQVADLIRDGEYDDHEATVAFARHRLAALATPARDDGFVTALAEAARSNVVWLLKGLDDEFRKNCGQRVYERIVRKAASLAQPATVERKFTNELGNRIKITIEGPHSTSENILTPVEVDELKLALDGQSKSATMASGDVEASLLKQRLEALMCEPIYHDWPDGDGYIKLGIKTARAITKAIATRRYEVDRAAIYEECAKIAEDYAQAADLQNQSGHVRAALNITDAILERKSQ